MRDEAAGREGRAGGREGRVVGREGRGSDRSRRAVGAVAEPGAGKKRANPLETLRDSLDARSAARNARGSERAARVREARVRPDRASASRPAEPRREAKAEEPIDVAAAARGAAGVARRFRVPLIALAAVLFLFVALYSPLQVYYKAWRDGMGLRTSIDAYDSSNQELTDNIQSLQTREGIEDEARRRGYVTDGETKVVVEGLPEEESEDPSKAQETDLPWYIKVGDTVFGYRAQGSQNSQ